MNLNDAKQQLKEKGYCSFNLEELNKNRFDLIKKYYMCNSEKNLQEHFVNLRADLIHQGKGADRYNNLNNKKDYESHEVASAHKSELLKRCINENLFATQIWYYNDINSINLKIQKLYENVDSDYLNDLIKTTYDEITRYFFDFPEEQQFSHLIEFTYYDKGCVLGKHSDGTGTGRICACLIYLNEEYDFNDGGYLILGDEERILPKFGNVAIIDLQSFNILHEVTEVTGGIGRYACLSFVKRKEDEFK